MMKISDRGLQLIKDFEGLHLKAYWDSYGEVWTIGYGTTNSDAGVIGKTIEKNTLISKSTAEVWLRESILKKYAPLVEKYDHKYHWNQNEFDALCSFCYNIGSIKQLTGDGSRDKRTIALKMLEYNKSGGKVLQGLVRRRKAEHNLFCEPVMVGYTGEYPRMPSRGYFKIGDGYKNLMSYRQEIRKVQRAVNWAMNSNLVDDGKYGPNTRDVVADLQDKYNLPVNGCYGKLCQNVIKGMKKTL